MKTLKLYISALFLSLTMMGFAQGIEFQNISLEQALNQAKELNKLVFIDFYTEWCGPCKKLAKNVFTVPEVGNYYNQHYINLTLDAEKAGLDAAKKYKITNYPTLLFLDEEGNVVYRNGGLISPDSLINMGKNAIKSLTSQYSLQKLQEEYPKRKTDEEFVKLYMTKMMEFGQNTIEPIETWLRLQTEIKEDSPEMLQFLLKNRNSILLGGKAEQIINENNDKFLTFVPKAEKVSFERLNIVIANNTLKEARRMKNPELMKKFIQSKREIVSSYGKNDDLVEYEMECAILSKDINGFKKIACNYVDSLIRVNPVKEINKSDKEAYFKFEKLNKEKTDATTQAMRNTHKEGLTANRLIKSIVETSELYLKYSESKQDYNIIYKWLAYCNKLIPDKFLVDNLKANMLYMQGDSKKAIALKTKAVKNTPELFKKKVNLVYELKLMNEGKPLK